MDNSVVKPVNPNDLVLDIVGRKYVSGSSLTTAEELMALSASAGEMAKNYGPGPAEMVLKKPELPENVKGILVEHAG
ncbi:MULTISPECIES: hypothetical protein [Desulfovibrio]|uniref:Uncharacterized protein n=2 Tax=root TaxID=1 RepID=A0A212JEM6_9BACT|nr:MULTISPECIES: hypothetical protein [Desulfovibrio]MBD8895647.1 hypothetical protein [Desulfovibrio desulfuricans]MBT9748408.1 hypothetical protein [Desulfovibrio desulfuricans]MCB6542190.1 hypothetical protein [Desulfovibrio desulfuricans]MCB6553818.1 hypothetical protein [Desulfovibrio desulfuricans]MCB6565233.1 hypothetical protein [Desulfovibrio desulfuricans]